MLAVSHSAPVLPASCFPLLNFSTVYFRCEVCVVGGTPDINPIPLYEDRQVAVTQFYIADRPEVSAGSDGANILPNDAWRGVVGFAPRRATNVGAEIVARQYRWWNWRWGAVKPLASRVAVCHCGKSSGKKTSKDTFELYEDNVADHGDGDQYGDTSKWAMVISAFPPHLAT